MDKMDKAGAKQIARIYRQQAQQFNEKPAKSNALWFYEALATEEQDRHLNYFIDASIDSWRYWDTVCELIKVYLNDDRPLPSKLKQWIFDVLDRKRKRPGKTGRQPDQYFFRNLSIILFIQEMKDTGRPASWAIDIVAKAFNKTPSTVTKIWENRKQTYSLQHFTPTMQGIIGD